jgi:hypothetical protein
MRIDSLRPLRLPMSPIVICLAAAELLLHYAGSGNYGFFRDELYYIACGDHLAWGYVDQPPLVAVIARLSRLLAGNSLSGFRLFPALAGACVVLLTGWMARELGGGRFAQVLAGLTIFLAPAHLAFGSFLSMNAFEPVFWMVCTCVLIRVLKGGDKRLWLLAGTVAGIGLLNKHTTLAFGCAVLAGLLLTRQWEQLRSQWLWLGILLAFAIFLPNLIWEAQNHWPQIEAVRNAQEFKNTPIAPLRFLGEQVLFLNPAAFPVIAAGLGWLFFAEGGRRVRCLGWAFVVLLAIVMALHGKTYYTMPAYPMVIAAGGAGLGAVLREPRRKWLRLAYPAVLVVSGIIMLPYGVPLLPITTFLRYQDAIPLARSVKTERDTEEKLPQLYQDMFGWESMAATVARVYHSLPPSQQPRCAILAGNYGEAAAIDMFGARHGLPKAISGHNNYYLWGPRGYTGEVVILFGEHAESIKPMFEDAEQAALISNPYAVAAENDLPVYVCRRPKIPLAALWPKLRFYI